MFTISNYEYDCTKKCRSQVHGNEITAALTKRSVTDDKLAAFIAKICKNFAEISDSSGRSALHLACSVGRYAIAEWLLNHGAIINCKDLESSHTPLHRSLFYGCIDCAVLLMRYGANVQAVDTDYRTPLQIIRKYNDLDQYKDVPQNTEVLVWGANKNYNLGVDNKEKSSLPQFLDIFRKQGICITNMAMSSYHSVFQSKDGELYVVGHGNGGRLGIGNESSVTTPKHIKLPVKQKDLEKVVKISCSKNHTLFLSNTNAVYACGINTDRQLGLRPIIDQSTVIREIVGLSNVNSKDIVNIVAKDHYSLVYTRHEIYVWGANRGQCNMKPDVQHLIDPKMILQQRDTISLVGASASAIACYTEDKRIWLLYNYKSKSIRSPNLDPLVYISIAEVDNEKGKKQAAEMNIKLLTLSTTNTISIWFDKSQQYIKCVYSIPYHIHIDKIIFKRSKLMILSKGEVFVGQTSMVIARGTYQIGVREFRNTLTKDAVSDSHHIRIDIKKLPNVDRVVDIFADDDFESFAILQENSRKYFMMPQFATEEYTFKNLLNEANEFDIVHDITFHVDNEVFPAHKFIVFTRSKGLMKIVSHYKDKNIYLNFTGLTAKMFELILKFIYSNYLISEEDLDDILQSMGPSVQAERVDVLNIFKEFVNKFELHELLNFLRRFDDNLQCFPQKAKSNFSPLKKTMMPGLYDVVIKCANNQEIHAHKCVLVARLEYFNLMFNSSWAETKVINLTTIPVEYMDPIIDFLYTLNANHFKKQKYSENFLYNMIVICDQFFINRLRRVCEVLILEKVSIRKCGEMLEFACSYNCELLEKGCLEFICQNLTRILDQHSLDICQPEVLARINVFYRDTFKEEMDFRVITPQSDSISDERLIEFVSDFTVDLDYNMNEDGETKSKVSPKIKLNKSAQSKRNYEKEAISSLRQISLDADEQTPSTSTTKSKIQAEIRELCDKAQLKSDKWMKVSEKKDVKKRVTATPLKTNQIMQEEKKPEENFTSLNQAIKSAKLSSKTIDAERIDEEKEGGTTHSNVSLIDFMKTEKLSQKQRKRLSSESANAKGEILNTSSKPIHIPENTEKHNDFTNVWQSPPMSEHSFAEIMKSPKSPKDSSFKASHGIPINETPKKATVSNSFPSNSATPVASTSRVESSCFSKILADERKQKEYFEKIKSKSLILTQIEETAIDELKSFYNVDNVFDEFITIDRKRVTTTMNFAVWQHK